VLAHPDLCKVTGRRPPIPDEWYDRMAAAAASSGIAAEVSSSGWRKPSDEVYSPPALLKRFHDLGVPVTTASDAHRRADVAHRSGDVRSIVAAAGYGSLCAFDGRRPREVPL
jgi:histidinol-phosphatase (PHP family)